MVLKTHGAVDMGTAELNCSINTENEHHTLEEKLFVKIEKQSQALQQNATFSRKQKKVRRAHYIRDIACINNAKQVCSHVHV